MKLAKQIITLSAAGLIAIGLALVLISGIVIGTEINGAYAKEILPAQVAYKESMQNIKAEYVGGWSYQRNAIVPVEESIIYMVEHYDYVTGEEVVIAEDALRLAKDDLTAAETALGLETNKGASADLDEVTRLKIDVARAKENVALKDDALKFAKNKKVHVKMAKEMRKAEEKVVKDTLKDAKVTAEMNRQANFTYAFKTQKSSTVLDMQGNFSTGYEDVLTPMASVMVVGMSFTFVGAALVLTVIIMNKFNGEKKATVAKKEKAAA